MEYQRDWTRKEILSPHNKTLNAQNKERILKAVKEKDQVTYKGSPIRITPETRKARRSWTDVMQTVREHKCQPSLLYLAKLSS
jgi:hypothetical protein